MPIPVWWWYISYRNITLSFASCCLNFDNGNEYFRVIIHSRFSISSGACFLEFVFFCVWIKWRFLSFSADASVGWEGKEAWEMFGVQHGNWSVWGTWTECLAEAWAGVRNRTRTCTDPVPRRGGRACVGQSVQYEPCSLGLEGEDLLWLIYLIISLHQYNPISEQLPVIFENSVITNLFYDRENYDSACINSHYMTN